MRRVTGFAFFFIAAGMILGYLVSGFIEFLIIVVLLLLAYIFFCR